MWVPVKQVFSVFKFYQAVHLYMHFSVCILFFVKKLKGNYLASMLGMPMWSVLFKLWIHHWLCNTGFAVAYWVLVAALDANLECAVNPYCLLGLLVIRYLSNIVCVCRHPFTSLIHISRFPLKVIFPEAHPWYNLVQIPCLFFCTSVVFCTSVLAFTPLPMKFYSVVYVSVLSTRLLAPPRASIFSVP